MWMNCDSSRMVAKRRRGPLSKKRGCSWRQWHRGIWLEHQQGSSVSLLRVNRSQVPHWVLQEDTKRPNCRMQLSLHTEGPQLRGGGGLWDKTTETFNIQKNPQFTEKLSNQFNHPWQRKTGKYTTCTSKKESLSLIFWEMQINITMRC